MYKVNGELFSCDITDSGIAPSREGDIQNCIISRTLKQIFQICLEFDCWVSKIAKSTHPIHLVVWGNFPFNSMYLSINCKTWQFIKETSSLHLDEMAQ